MGELLTLRGKVTETGVYTLDSDLLYSTVNAVRIPKGLKAKIWCKRISGEAADLAIEFTYDITTGSPTWKAVSNEKLASPGEIILEKRRPSVLIGFTGKEAFRVSRLSGTGDSFIDLDVELGTEK